MFRSFLLFLFLALTLSALSNSALLKRADGFVKSSNKSNQFRAYNDYKNLYLRALMHEDTKLKFNALKGIVKSGNKLHIDISQYSKELRSLQPRTRYKAPKHKTYKKKSKLEKSIKLTSSHKLKSIHWKDSKLVLAFDKKLRSNQINYFTLYDAKRKKYKYVFDIHASMLTRSEDLRKDAIDTIKLAQHNSNTLRLVIENSQKVTIHFKRDASKLIISMENKSYSKRKKSYPKRLDKNKIIVIDAGHGGKDPGATGYHHYREKVVVLQIAKKLRNILKSRGFTVYMTRDRDYFVKLSNRTKFANKKHADLFISIHANAVSKSKIYKARGIECYYLSTSRSGRAKRVAAKENSADLSDAGFYGKQTFLNTLNSHNIIAANKLAIDLQRGALASLKKRYKHVVDAGVRDGPFWVLVGAQMPSVLVEVGFITNPTEAKRLVNSKYQSSLAHGLANGVERYFLHNQ